MPDLAGGTSLVDIVTVATCHLPVPGAFQPQSFCRSQASRSQMWCGEQGDAFYLGHAVASVRIKGGFVHAEPFENGVNTILVKSGGTKMVLALAQANAENKVASHSVSNISFLHMLSFQYLYKKLLCED